MVERLPAAVKAGLTSKIADTRRRFDSAYGGGRDSENKSLPLAAYAVVQTFVREIRAVIPPADTESITAADFLVTFCDKMQVMLMSWADGKQSLEQRIAAVLKEYYTDAALSLKLTMLKRLTQ